MANENREEISIDSRILSSSHLNFFFGAGVNGRSVKQMKDLKETNELLSKVSGNEIVNFEAELEKLDSETRDLVLEKFIKELRNDIGNVDYMHQDIRDQLKMFNSFNHLLLSSENRTKTMRQINIYTTNYDPVVESVLNKAGYLCNVISSSNLESNDKFFDMIGYDYSRDVFVPTYLISKIHGDLDNPILPSKNKFNETLQRKRFEILFRMKSQLSRRNSLLFIIGYSGNDEHLNQLISDSISFGLTVYWFKYDNEDDVPEILANKINVIEQEDNDKKKNPTLICRLNGGGSATYTEIEMDEEYSRLVVDVLYKTNSVEVKYILEIQSNSNGSWSYVTSFYSTQSSGTITTQILLCDGYSYRLKIENPDNFLGRSTTMQVKWRGMRYVTYGY